MVDVLSREQRRKNMRSIRGKDTRPELIVRRLVHSLGYRFRLHRRDLPGSPDLVLPRLAVVIFVHGCYWHRHDCKLGRPVPGTRTDFWMKKFADNVRRDSRAAKELQELGWRVVVVWECETRASRLEDLRTRLRDTLAEHSKTIG